MSCPDAETLARFTQGLLAAGALEAFEKHLVGCEACLQVVSELARGERPSAGGPAPADGSLLVRRGDTVGRYVVIDLLGSGGVGVVYTGYDPLLDRKVALKLLRPSPEGTADAVEQDRARLLREAQTLARVSHPNVVAVYDVGTVGEQVFMAFERVDGSTLADWLRTRRRWKEIRDAFVAAGRGLAAAHEAGVVHRDFKPSNVLVGSDGRIRVADFGFALGTRGFMAPEVVAGQPDDARSDQYSFCVSLHESLHGDKAQSSGRPPARLRAALARGMARRPEERFPDMAALLEALQRDPVRKAAPWAAAGLAASLALVSLAGARHATSSQGRMCSGATERLATAWSGARRAAARQAFEATGLPYARDAWRATEQVLGSYAASWSAMRTDACEATRVRGEQSEEVMDLRMDCLDARARGLSLLMDTLQAADAAVVAHPLAVEDLPSLAACADVEGLRRPQRPPGDPARRERLEKLRSDLARARALLAVGGFAAARDLSVPLVADARELAYRPAEAEALFVLGEAQREAGDYPSAARSLQDAALAAEVGRDVHLEALAYLRLATVQGPIQRQFEQGALGCAHVRACLEQIGRDVELEAGAMDVDAQLAYLAGRLDESVGTFSRAIQLLEPVAGPDDGRVAALRSFEGFVLADLGRFPEAVRLEQDALESRRRTFGPSHPEVARSETNLGLVHAALGDADAALADFRAAKAVWDAFAPEHPLAGFAEQGIADALLELGQLEEARGAADDALRIVSKGFGPDHPRVASALLTVGRSELAAGALDEAERDFQRSFVLYAPPASSPTRQAWPLAGLGRVLLARKKARDALVPLERAFALFEELPGGAHGHAAPPLALAAALWDSATDRPRSLALARRARDEARHLPPRHTLRREIDLWLAAHDAPGGRP